MKRIPSSPSNGDPRTNAAFWVTGIADALAVEQLDVPALFRDVGLDFAALGDPDARFAIDKVNALWELALARSGNPAVGLLGAVQAKPRHFGIVAYALMSAPDLLGIIHRISRYLAILSDAAVVSASKRGDSYRLLLTVKSGSQPAPHQRFAFDLLRFLSFCRWITDTEFIPAAVELSHPGENRRPFLPRRSVACRGSVRQRTPSFSPPPMPPGHCRCQTIGWRPCMIVSRQNICSAWPVRRSKQASAR